MNPFLNYLKSTPKIRDILDQIKNHNNYVISGANNEIASLISLCDFEENNENIVIVTPNIYQSQKVYDILSRVHSDVFFYPKDDFVAQELLTESLEFRLLRIDTLKAIFSNKKNIIITNTSALLNKVPLKSDYESKIIYLKPGDSIKPIDLMSKLIESGYDRCYTVEKQGEISLRGGIIDIFPINEDHPYRLDFFGNDIESIKILDIESQRSKNSVDSIVVMPASEVFFSESERDVINFFINERLSEIKDDQSIDKFEKDLEYLNESHNYLALQKYLSIFIKENYSFIDYIENKKIYYFDWDGVENAASFVFNEASNYLENCINYLRPGDFINEINSINSNNNIYINYKNESNESIFVLDEIANYDNNLDLFKFELETTLKNKTVVVSLDDKSYYIITDYFKANKIVFNEGSIKDRKINIIKDLYFYPIYFDNIFIINHEKLLKNYKKYTTNYKTGPENKRLKHISELKFGDYVVHFDYGIGKYVGIETKTVGSKTSDYIHIKYAEENSLFIPVEKLNILSKYSSEEGYVPKLSKLNSKEWTKTKESAKAHASGLADMLMSVYSERENTEGFKYLEDDEIQLQFENEFGYDLTIDQEKAINDTKNDMMQGKLMDRLVCGDVGFGKTEVALRAAFKAVLSGKQVAYLAPTTILARQHYHTFKVRMDKYGVEIALVNRFVSSKSINSSLSNLKKGVVDIIIGTHRLLSKDVEFKDLGLVIIDEEQRFGVEAKEKLKYLKKNVDVLTLTATPIPRTLQMAITGLKSISVIETPPKGRYPIQTYVLARNDYVVKDAIERELSKDGQVFYLYNRVEDSSKIITYLHELVPDAIIATVNGQMESKAIENVLQSFIDKKIDILVATSIIETGIDIPNVNTLIVHDSERYGLSQLYQIKGRVGRSNKISYAYLMYEPGKKLTDEAKKRLQNIKEFAELGSGFKIAVRDLTARGAGEILGKEQTGFMNKVGMDLYLKLLNDEISKKKGEYVPPKEDDILLNISRYIDGSYIEDDYVKIEFHTKISKLKNLAELSDLQVEMKDRFGDIPKMLDEYMYSKLTENILNSMKFERVELKELYALFVISAEMSKNIDAQSLFMYSLKVSNNFKFYFKLGKIMIEYYEPENRHNMYIKLSEYLENIHQDYLI